jgi:hypothetical protein
MKIGSKGSAAAPRLQPDFVRYPGLAKPHPGLNSDRCSAAKSGAPRSDTSTLHLPFFGSTLAAMRYNRLAVAT